MFKFIETEIPEVIIVEPQVFWDERGFFMETYSEKEFKQNWIIVNFVQDNHSKSSAWVLRWLHFQTINTQSKLVRVISWSVYDVAVDLRKGSPTYWKWIWEILSAKNKKQLFIPQGFAHWFLTLEDNTEFVYKCDDFYNPEWDWWISYDSTYLNINWWDFFDKEKLIISEKDQIHNEFEKNNFYFGYRELTENIYAYIDMQNIYKSFYRETNWKELDWKKFYIFLTNKYRTKKIYLFLWYIKNQERFYNRLKEWWYELVFRQVTTINWKIKWNVDTELTLQVISDIHLFNKAILITSDWDFVSVVKKLNQEWKLYKLLSPTYRHCSMLLKNEAKEKIVYIKTFFDKFTRN